MKRKARIELLLTEEEKVSIKKAAAEARLSITDYCTSMILKGQVISPFGPTELKLMANLSGMANNLNQAVKRMHQDKVSANQIEKVMMVLSEIEKLLP